METEEQKQPTSATGAARERVDAWCERGILWLVLGVVVFGPLALGAVRPSEFLVLQFLTVGILLLWVVRSWYGRTPRLLWPPICWGVVAFVAYAVYRYATAEVEYVARQELIRVLMYAALFFAILNNLHRQEATRWIAIALIALGALTSLYAVYQWVTGSERVWHFLKPACYLKRASGTYICPNHFASFLGLLMPVALSYTLLGRFKAVSRVLLGYAALAMLGGIAVTLSRGAYLATCVGLMAFFLCLLWQRSHRMIGVICLAVVLAGGSLFYFKSAQWQERLLETQLGGYQKNLRLRLWPVAWQMWQDHFWLGVGPAHFDLRYRAYRYAPEAIDKMQTRPGYVHNDYLNTLVDWGLIGTALVLVPWVALYGGVFWNWRFIRRRPNDLAHKRSNKSAFVLGAAVGLLTLLVHSFGDFNMHIPANAILAVTLMALVSAHLRFASDRFWVTQRGVGRIAGTLVLGTAMVYLGWQGCRQVREQWWLGRAARLQAEPAARLAALEKAFRVEPRNSETAYAAGETLRLESWRGEDGWEKLARSALEWFQRSRVLNAHDPYPCLGYGMSLDWLGRHAESGEWFERALKLDPYSYFTRAHLGWHYFQMEEYEKAQEWFEKSIQVNWMNNPIARTYLELTAKKLAEKKKAPPQ